MPVSLNISPSRWVLIIVIIIALVMAAAAYKGWTRPAEKITEYLPLPAPDVLAKVKYVTKQCPEPGIQVIEKEVVVEKLVLPEPVASDERKEVTAAAEVPAYEGKTSVVSVIDMETGKTEIHAKQLPRPFLELLNRKELGLRVGYDTGIEMTGEAYGRWTFLRVASFHLAAYGEVAEDNAKAMLELSYRW